MASSCFCESFLEGLGLQEYSKRFATQGYERFLDIATISVKDLGSRLYINDDDHKKAILQAVDKLSSKSWLQEYNLEIYEQSFKDEQILTIRDLRELKLNDLEDILDKLEIMVPGHRKRFSLAVQSLQSSNTVEEPMSFSLSDAVAVGYWRRPEQFEKLEHDFLCVKGCFRSAKDVNKQSDELEFLLDSGSDVVTARQHIINEMALEHTNNVYSCGIHTMTKKELYKGYLKIGNSHWIDVEVVSSDYESIGSPVLKTFNSYIDGKAQYWLPTPQSSL